MKIGGLYQLKKYYWFLFPSSDDALDDDSIVAGVVRTATAAAGAAGGRCLADADADNWANYWSEQLNCNVSYVETNSMFVLLEQTERFCKVLSTEGMVGWIIYPENEAWTKNCIEEVKEIS